MRLTLPSLISPHGMPQPAPRMKQDLLVGVILLSLLRQAPCLGKQYALNVPVVLLPYVPASTGVKVNFTLASPQGCFTW